jgi:pimeloyl-ACP methyl ester carboxylesterase
MAATARFLFLHGFASDARSPMGVAIAEHLARLGTPVVGLDLRVPSLETMRLSAMLETTRRAIGGPTDRAVLIGSSLGGLAAARLAERDARVSGLVLLAPAFRAMERWRRRIGEPAWDAWRERGWLRIRDESTGAPARIDFGFAEDVLAIDGTDDGWPDVRVPTLILHGRRDDLILPELSRQFSRGRPHVRLVELDDGHDMVATRATVLAEIEGFLAPWLGPLHSLESHIAAPARRASATWR